MDVADELVVVRDGLRRIRAAEPEVAGVEAQAEERRVEPAISRAWIDPIRPAPTTPIRTRPVITGSSPPRRRSSGDTVRDRGDPAAIRIGAGRARQPPDLRAAR
ncbi:MAG TPA: hypothetical protein VHM48_11235, partial [Candidatus Limnocylindrales bacterium]|nr:hypothetical protein [Candidatus Limnocylindrales bacterium]